MSIMKFILTKSNSANHKMVNLANVADIFVSDNYLMLLMNDGREERFAYGSNEEMTALFNVIAEFIEGEGRLLNCDKYMPTR